MYLTLTDFLLAGVIAVGPGAGDREHVVGGQGAADGQAAQRLRGQERKNEDRRWREGVSADRENAEKGNGRAVEGAADRRGHAQGHARLLPPQAGGAQEARGGRRRPAHALRLGRLQAAQEPAPRHWRAQLEVQVIDHQIVSHSVTRILSCLLPRLPRCAR